MCRLQFIDHLSQLWSILKFTGEPALLPDALHRQTVMKVVQLCKDTQSTTKATNCNFQNLASIGLGQQSLCTGNGPESIVQDTINGPKTYSNTDSRTRTALYIAAHIIMQNLL